MVYKFGLLLFGKRSFNTSGEGGLRNNMYNKLLLKIRFIFYFIAYIDTSFIIMESMRGRI